MQHCSLQGRPLEPAWAVFDFQNSQDGLNDPKGKKYNLQYNDIREDWAIDHIQDQASPYNRKYLNLLVMLNKLRCHAHF